MFSLLHLIAVTPPFPSSSSTSLPVTNFGGQLSAPDALAAASNAGATAASGATNLWKEWVSPDSPFYQALISATAPLAALGFALWATFWARDLIHDHRNPIHWQKVAWPLIVIMLLYNHGTLLASSTLAGKALTYKIADAILNDTSSGITAKLALQAARYKSGFTNYVNAQQQICVGITDKDKYNQCMTNIKVQAAEVSAKASGITVGLPGASITVDLLAPLKIAAAGAIISLLWASSAAFHYLAALVLAVWAATGPLWVSITLLPISTKGINFFISGFVGISLLIVSENMLNAAVAVSLAEAPGTDPLFVPLLMGLLNPFLAVIIGSGGAVGMFVGISKGVSWLVGKFI